MQKYFVNRDGAVTARLRGKPGESHYAIAEKSVEPGDDVYARMFEHGYMRVAETDTEVQVEYPKRMSPAQKRFIEEKRMEGKTVQVNDPAFIASKEQR